MKTYQLPILWQAATGVQPSYPVNCLHPSQTVKYCNMDTPLVEQSDPELVAFWLRFFRRGVAALQVVGGLYGLYLVVFATPSGVSHAVLFFAIVLFGTSIWGGVLLALDKTLGVAVSLIIQAMQVLQIAAPGFLYSFACGLWLVVGPAVRPDFVGANFSWYLGARFNATTDSPADLSQTGVTFTGINLAAVLAFLFLLYVRSTRSQLKADNT